MNGMPSSANAATGQYLAVTSLGSGSSGNALLVRTETSTLLVDCGVGVRRMTRVLAAHNLDVSNIDALLISHEHADHVRELPRFVGKGTAIFSTRGTALAARVPRQQWAEVTPGAAQTVAGIDVTPIPVSHDALEPCGYLLRAAGGTITVLTDLGCASGEAAEAIAESDLVVLEANHDEALLRRGPYPPHLQRRILSDSGHLSNADCAELLVTALRDTRRLPSVWLAHLSETNNRPGVAVRTVTRRLAQDGLRLEVHALPRCEASTEWRPDAARIGQRQLMLEFE